MQFGICLAILSFACAGSGLEYLMSSLRGWIGFLLLSSYIVGSLHEQKQKRIKELRRCCGDQFDPEVAEEFSMVLTQRLETV